MDKKLWEIFDRRQADVLDRLQVMHARISEVNNTVVESGFLQTEIERLKTEVNRLLEENAILAGKLEDDPANPYGYELILDLHGCDPSTFNRTSMRKFFRKLCEVIDMKRCSLHFWDDRGLPPEERQTSPHTKGISAVQFILTSSVVIHTLDLMGAVYVNIFSCKLFDPQTAEILTKEWFRATECRRHFISRV